VSSKPTAPITVITTVRNDREALAQLLSALANQTVRPAELVIVDAGSTDGTQRVARDTRLPFPVRCIVAPDVNISRGRNIAVDAATTQWVASTDAGCVPTPRWLESFSTACDGADFLAGVYDVDARTPFEREIRAALYPDPSELDDPSALVTVSHRLFGRDFAATKATGRSMAFTREAWQRGGGFPEHLYAGEDVAFSTRVDRAGCRMRLVPDAIVCWRPRSSLSAYARMFHAYSRGDIRLGARRRQLARGTAYAAAATLLWKGGPFTRAAVVGGFSANIALPLVRAYRARMGVGAYARIPMLVVFKDIVQLAGAASGLIDAASGKNQPHEDRF
jgi:GT2 family glycosyltransferase